MKNSAELDNRLLACASLVRTGSVAADIGSDHAYLPIYLVKNQICPRAIASDINKGPVERARINIAVSGLSDKIDVLLADGLDKAAPLLPDDIIIAGMGGELIRDIIAASEYVKNPCVRLILQPMTMPEILREYLAENGFNIINERICASRSKYYQISCAEYDGVKRIFDPHELLLGKKNIERIRAHGAVDDERELVARVANAAGKRIEGMRQSENPDTDAIEKDQKLLNFCKELLEC